MFTIGDLATNLSKVILFRTIQIVAAIVTDNAIVGPSAYTIVYYQLPLQQDYHTQRLNNFKETTTPLLWQGGSAAMVVVGVGVGVGSVEI